MKMKKQVIEVEKKFAKYPAGRYKKDGPYSGEEFRESFLLPAFKNEENTKVVVQFKNVRGLASSFLEESFGGLVREGLTSEEILSKLEILCHDETIIQEITQYINEAKPC